MGNSLGSGSRLRATLLEIARGKVSGYDSVWKYGRNPAVSTTEIDVWNTGGVLVWPTSAGTVTITHGGNDVADGTGARSIVLEGLDSNFDPLTETVTLGAGPTTVSAQSFVRINCAYVDTCGTYAQTYTTPFGTNDAAITGAIGGNTMFTIGAGLGRTQLSHYTVPAGKSAYLGLFQAECEADKFATVRLWQRPNADDTTGDVSARRLIASFDRLQGEEFTDINYAVCLAEKTDVWCSSFRSTGSTAVETEYYMVLVDN